MKKVIIESSYGETIIDGDTGEIISIDPELQERYNINKFDVKEWEDYKIKNGHTRNIEEGLDITEIGYWNKMGRYFQADSKQRDFFYPQK